VVFPIVVNEALKQARLQRRYSSLDDNDDEAQNLAEWLIDPHCGLINWLKWKSRGV
jgi:hypothetical protein